MAALSIHHFLDQPGPRAQARIRLFSMLCAVVVVGGLTYVLAEFASRDGFAAEKWSIFFQGPVLWLLFQAAVATVQVTLMSVVLALPVALVLAVSRVWGWAPLSALSRGVTEVTRSIPTLLLLYVTILLLPTYGLRLPIFWQVVLALSVSNVGLLAEILRAAMNAVPRGQMEAGQSLGMSRLQAYRHLVVPQALTAAMPALVAQLTFILKSSTLGYVVSYSELLHTSRVIGAFQNNLLQSIIVATLVYLVINLLLSRAAFFLERRASRRGARPGISTKEVFA